MRRDRLLRAFAAVEDQVPLVLLVAPAGYGKTTALSQWVGEDDRSFGWVRLDESDNDPVNLLRHVALALHQIQPVDDAVWQALASPSVSPRGVVVPRLVASATANGGPWVLVLDDFHVLTGTVGMDLVIALAMGLPSGCHIFVTSRGRPGMRLSRMRSQGKLVEFGTRDLAFTVDEASAVLVRMGIKLSREAIAALVRRTEGWPAGIYLAALSVQGAPDEVAAAGVAGTDKFIVEYFREEVLVRESAETVRFLLRTAVLDEMSGPLCDAVLGHTGSATWLAEIEGRNLFLVPQDRDGRWYRYHRLFGEMLLSELRRREPGEEQHVHRRASAWYEEHGSPDRAVTHALAGRDTPTAARLVTAYGQRFYNAGRIYTVRGWLGELDEGALEEHPGLAVVAGWIWALTGEAARAQRCLLAAEQAAPDAEPPAGSVSLTSSIAILRGALAPFGIERMLVDTRRAFELEPPAGSWYTLAGLLYGAALMFNGEPERAAKAFERAAYFGRDNQPSGASFALAQLSLFAAERGDWETARDYATESWTLIDKAGLPDYLGSIVSYIARAKVAVHDGDIAGARHHVGRALRLYASPSPAAFPWLAAQTALLLGRILLLDLDDHPAARLKLAEAGRHLNRLLTEGVLRDQHRQLAADLARHGGRPRVPSAMTLTAAELRVLELLPTHLTLAEIADVLHTSRNTVKSQVAAVYRKLRAATRAEAVHEGRNVGLIE